MVTKVYPIDSYQIAAPSNKGNNQYVTTAHVSKLKSYRLPEKEQQIEENFR